MRVGFKKTSRLVLQECQNLLLAEENRRDAARGKCSRAVTSFTNLGLVLIGGLPRRNTMSKGTRKTDEDVARKVPVEQKR